MKGLQVFVGEWDVAAVFPTDPPGAMGGRCVFEPTLDGAFLSQLSKAPDPIPSSMAIIAAGGEPGTYTQHYFDSRGVVRTYAMTFRDGVWTLSRDSADFSPLDFHQRFTGRFSSDGNAIRGEWQISPDGSAWKHDFDITYTRLSAGTAPPR